MLKVLLVDDEPAVIEILKNTINWTELGFTICATAANGEEALNYIKQLNPHIAIIDINMPVINGIQLLSNVSDMMYLRTKFIILSAYNSFEFAKQAMKYNVNEYILKPIDAEEITEVLVRFRNVIKDEIVNGEAMLKDLKYVVNNYILRLIRNEYSKNLIERLSFLLGINSHTEICCAQIRIFDQESDLFEISDIEFRAVRDSIRKIIENFVGSNNEFKVFQDNILSFGVLLTPEMESMNDERLLQKLIEDIKLKTGYSVKLGLSEKKVGIDSIGQLYRQTLYVLNLRNESETALLKYIDNRGTQVDNKIFSFDVKDIVSDIKNLNEGNFESHIENINKFIKSNNLSVVAVKDFLVNFQIEIFNSIYELGNTENGSQLELFEITELRNFSNDQELYKIIETIITYAADYVKKQKAQKKHGVVWDVKEYVKENYSKDIKLNNIAKIFYINAAYLGQLFIKATGMQFNEYVHQVRIEEAKKLLRKTDRKISEIAQTVGYNDSDYFVSKFKELTKSVPTAYKKMYSVSSRGDV